MADFNNPLATQDYLGLLASIVENNKAALTLLQGVTVLNNLPVNAKRWNPTANRFENWNGTAWQALTALIEMKVRNSDQLNGQAAAFYRNAANLNAGILAAARFNNSSHGNRGGGSLHATVTTTVNGFMAAADKIKLNGIEAGATGDQNAGQILSLLLTVDGVGSGLDADLLDGWHRDSIRARANHTGTQPLSTISDAGAVAHLDMIPATYLNSGLTEDEWVRDRIASSVAGALGTYAFLKSLNSVTRAYSPGDTESASNLEWASILIYTDTFPYSKHTSIISAGTWRCMGYAPYTSFGGTEDGNHTIWLRIA